MSRSEIVNFLNNTLAVSDIHDSSNNGLQVQGADEIEKIGLAVDACMATYEKAAKERCDMLIVHHGLIWNGIDYVSGRNYSHIKYLIDHHISLYAAHLPLDMHPKYGNNRNLARLLSLGALVPFGKYRGSEIGFQGRLKRPLSNNEISEKLQKTLHGRSTILSFGPKKNRTVAIVSGGGADALQEAIDKGIDCLLTGEGSHSAYHLAKESGINLIYLGHYHSEQLGVLAIGKLLHEKFNLKTAYLDEPPIELLETGK